MEWISVKESPPPKSGQEFIAYSKVRKIVFVAYGNQYGYFDTNGNGVGFSFWMPLPEPPKTN